MAVLPWLDLAAADVVDTHAPSKVHAAHVAKEAGWTLASAEQTQCMGFRQNLPEHSTFQFVPVGRGDVGVHVHRGGAACDPR